MLMEFDYIFDGQEYITKKGDKYKISFSYFLNGKVLKKIDFDTYQLVKIRCILGEIYVINNRQIPLERYFDYTFKVYHYLYKKGNKIYFLGDVN